MSAWIVSKRHIDVLVTGLIERGGYHHRGKWVAVSEENATETGKMLWAENHKSIRYRYGSKERTPEYHYSRLGIKSLMDADGHIGRGTLAKQVSCYDYQTCEHPEYYTSQAHSAMLGICMSLLHKVEGYGEADWGV
jgi:hypothetical protein